MTDHQSDAPDRRVDDRPLVAGRGPASLRRGQMDLAIDRNRSVRSNQAGAVVDGLAGPLGQPADEIKIKLRSQRAKPVRRRSGDRLRRRGGIAEARGRQFRKHDKLGAISFGLAREIRYPVEIRRDFISRHELRNAEPRLPAIRPGLMSIEPKEITWIPTES